MTLRPETPPFWHQDAARYVMYDTALVAIALPLPVLHPLGVRAAHIGERRGAVLALE